MRAPLHSSPAHHSSSPALRKLYVVAGLAIWVGLLAGGFRWIMKYQTDAGIAAAPMSSWPETAGLPFDPQHFNLVVFAHPQCPCTRATLDELELVITRRGPQIKATLCIFDPAGVPADWTETSLVRRARKIPGLQVVVDQNGALAAKFGVMTSGQVFFFDQKGQRVFSGGITGMRGQAGENRGRNLVLAAAAGEVCTLGETPVFGCALHEKTAEAAK